MAEGTGRRRQTPAGATEENLRVTKRMVLKRERVLIMPAGCTTVDEIKALGATMAKQVKIVDAWVPVGEFDGASKTRAIEAHAGKPGTPDAKPGAYKAPSVTAWSGGEEYTKPPEPKVERKALT